MKCSWALAVGASIAVSVPVGATALVLPGSVQRSGIERVQASPGTDGVRSKEQRNSKTEPRRDQRRDRQRRDGDGERSNNAPPNPPDPPGCVFRKGPLDLIV